MALSGHMGSLDVSNLLKPVLARYRAALNWKRLALHRVFPKDDVRVRWPSRLMANRAPRRADLWRNT
jgi:hypothetical protein